MSSLIPAKRKTPPPAEPLPSNPSTSTTTTAASKRPRTSPSRPSVPSLHPSLPLKPDVTPLPSMPSQPTSSPPKSKRPTPKPKAPRSKIVKLVPPRPAGSSLPSGSAVTGPTGQIKGRDVILVSRKVGLGALMRRCRALVVEEGLERITLHALTASIPHCLTLLHALLAILPFPHRHVSHTITTSSVRVTDELVPEEHGPEDDPAVGEGDAAEGDGEGGGLRGRWCAGLEVVIRVGSKGRGSSVGNGVVDAGEGKKKHKRAKRKGKGALAELTDEGGLPGLGGEKGKGREKVVTAGKKGGKGVINGAAGRQEASGGRGKEGGLVSSQREMSVDAEGWEGTEGSGGGAGGGGVEVDMDDEEMAMNG